MENDYQYLDPEKKYSDSNGVLHNLANIKDEKILMNFESLKVAKRLEELQENPIKIIDSSALLKIHHYLFQDVYKWAGELRTVNISKGGKPFFAGERFAFGFQYCDSLISDFKRIKKSDKLKISEKLAEILDNVNFLHPFREGNGRTQREFIRTLALQKGFVINLNPPDNREVYDKYMKGTIESNTELLTELILEQIEGKKRNE
jgi:cell filamentation protein